MIKITCTYWFYFCIHLYQSKAHYNAHLCTYVISTLGDKDLVMSKEKTSNYDLVASIDSEDADTG